jgi:hypothetical protein
LAGKARTRNEERNGMRKKVEGDTYHQRMIDSIGGDDGGRFAGYNGETRIVGSHSSPYPPAAVALSSHPELPDDFTDKVSEPTSMTFDRDLTRLPEAPAPASLVSQGPPEEGSALSPSAEPSSFSEEPEHG